jgi:hypothetical protein
MVAVVGGTVLAGTVVAGAADVVVGAGWVATTGTSRTGGGAVFVSTLGVKGSSPEAVAGSKNSSAALPDVSLSPSRRTSTNPPTRTATAAMLPPITQAEFQRRFGGLCGGADTTGCTDCTAVGGGNG